MSFFLSFFLSSNPQSIAGVPFDSARCFRASLLLYTNLWACDMSVCCILGPSKTLEATVRCSQEFIPTRADSEVVRVLSCYLVLISKEFEELLSSLWPLAASDLLPQGVVPLPSWRTGLPSGSLWWAGAGACMTCMVLTVLVMRVWQARVHLLRLSLLATKTFCAKLLWHCH